MQWISNSNILIVGLGLMGGSYARALKRLGYHVIAIDQKQSSIDFALENGLIDRGYAWVEPTAVQSADAVIFALYPGAFRQWIEEYQQLFKPGALLTDVTGVKGCIIYDIQGMLRQDVEYIAAHPMAGREVYGVENSDDRIFHDANYIVTPTDKNTPQAVEWCKSLGRILGFRHIAELSPEEHDEMIGFLSQLTHCIAVALMDCKESEHLAEYTGDSFRDLTRIARINENMWTELFLENRNFLLEETRLLIKNLQEYADALEDNDGARLKELLKEGRIQKEKADMDDMK